MAKQNTVIRSVSPSGQLLLPQDGDCPILEESRIPPTPAATTLILNRPDVLNALTLRMFCALYNRISYIEHHTKIKTILLKGRGRAFCAGGDVRHFHSIGRNGSGDLRTVDHVFRSEYRLISLLATALRRVSVVALLDGIVMGGGAGLSIHGRWRVATENSVFAMPECAIGLYPDIAALYVLSRIHYPGLGIYLTLTGGRLTGRQLVETGIATHFVSSHRLDSLECALLEGKLQTDEDVGAVLNHFSNEIENDEEEAKRRKQAIPSGLFVMRKFFTNDSVEAIIQALDDFLTTGSRQDIDKDDILFARDALERISAGAPLSLKVSWEMFQRAKVLTLNECLKLEFRLTVRFIRRPDFYEGVRSALVTRDRRPKWDPVSLQDVSTSDVEIMFRPLINDVSIDELDLDDTSQAGFVQQLDGRPKL